MVTIKGPINIRMDGRPISSLIDEKVKEVKTSPKLPFEAEGWQSEKNHDLVKGGKKLVKGKEKVKEKEKPVEVTISKAKTVRRRKSKIKG